jgi:hypothetical protein
LEQFDWLNPASTLMAVLVGAALTYFSTHIFERRRINEERLARAYGIIFAVHKMTNDLIKLNDHLAQCIGEATQAGISGPTWTKISDIIGFSDSEVSIPPEDLAIVAITRDVEMVTEIREIEAAHHSYIKSMFKLSELRQKLDASGLHTAVQGQVVSFEATPDEYLKIAPTIINLETLTNSLLEGLPRAVLQAKNVASKLGPHLKSYYKFKHFIVLAFPGSEPVATGT